MKHMLISFQIGHSRENRRHILFDKGSANRCSGLAFYQGTVSTAIKKPSLITVTTTKFFKDLLTIADCKSVHFYHMIKK